MIDALTNALRALKPLFDGREAYGVHVKEGHANFVTDIDVKAQSLLMDSLHGILPGADFVGEERANEPLSDKPTWIIDPIDGTTNFIRARRCSAVSVGLTVDKRPVLAAIYQPYTDEVFSAEIGKGARCNGQPIHVSDMPLDKALVGYGTSPYYEDLWDDTFGACREFLRRAVDLRRCGSAALDLCDIACGKLDIFFEMRLSPWDYCAGALLVTEAGGRISLDGKENGVFGEPKRVLAANAACFDAANEILNAINRN